VAILRAMSAAGRPRVAFVGAKPEFVERYAPMLGEALRDLRVEAVGVLLRDLRERGSEGLHPLDPPQCVAALHGAMSRCVTSWRVPGCRW
jgi:hypothetical protein